MRPFGILFIIFCVNIAIRNKSVKKMYICFLGWEFLFAGSRMNYGYFIKVAGVELEYNDVLLAILFVLSLFLILDIKKFSRKIVINSLLLLTIILIGIVWCIISPAETNVIDFNHSWDFYLRGVANQMLPVSFSMQGILMFFRVIIFVSILFTAYTVISENEWMMIASSVLTKFKVVIIYCVFEYIGKTLLKLPLNEYLNIFFGKGVSTGGGLDRLQGLCREPSYYALALFNFIALALIVGYFRKTKEYLWIAVAITLGILSTSFSFWICLIATVLLWTYLKGENNKRVRFVIMGGIAILFCSLVVMISSNPFLIMAIESNSEILNRIAESVMQIRNGFAGTITIGKDFSSEAARLGGGVLTLKAGLLRPLFGLGIGTAYCVTGLICIFANIGLIGLVQWGKLLFKDYGRNLPWSIGMIILLPVLFCNDLYTLYDTFYLLLIPTLSTALDMEKSR